VEPVRILLAKLPAALREVVVRALADQTDLRVVGEVDDPVETLLYVGEIQADVVIVGMHDDELPGVASHLVNEYPSITVLAVSSDSRQAFLYELRPTLTPIGAVSRETLLGAIRASRRSGVA
jgi:DNA-binding NarL/FixJ family response regulator